MAVAGVIYVENRVVRSVLGLIVPLFVALPRMYVGGHYPSDILAGFILGLAGTLSALHLFEPRLLALVQKAFDSGWQRLHLETVVFFLILEIEFKDVVWLTEAVPKLFLR